MKFGGRKPPKSLQGTRAGRPVLLTAEDTEGRNTVRINDIGRSRRLEQAVDLRRIRVTASAVLGEDIQSRSRSRIIIVKKLARPLANKFKTDADVNQGYWLDFRDLLVYGDQFLNYDYSAA